MPTKAKDIDGKWKRKALAYRESSKVQYVSEGIPMLASSLSTPQEADRATISRHVMPTVSHRIFVVGNLEEDRGDKNKMFDF